MTERQPMNPIESEVESVHYTIEQVCSFKREICVNLRDLTGRAPGEKGSWRAATVGAYTHDTETPDEASQRIVRQSPVVSFSGGFDRKEWERLKRAVDGAFDAYESRWPTP
jgi:hypothetical protein